MKAIMTFNNKTHSIDNDPRETSPTFSISIGTMEIVVDYATRKFVYVQGYFPLVKSQKVDMNVPLADKGHYYFSDIDMDKIREFGVFELSEKLPASEPYFFDGKVLFDHERGIIRIGGDPSDADTLVKINDNIIVGQDTSLALKFLYIMPDRFI